MKYTHNPRERSRRLAQSKASKLKNKTGYKSTAPARSVSRLVDLMEKSTPRPKKPLSIWERIALHVADLVRKFFNFLRGQ